MSGSGIGGTLGTALGVALAPETGGMSLAIPALGGAAGSLAGGAFTGSKNLWRDALLGGIGGGISGGVNNFAAGRDAFGGLFDPASGAISGAAESVSPALAAADPSLVAATTAPSSLMSGISKVLPYAALSGGALLADNYTKPKQVGPETQSHPSNPGQVAPLSRQQQNVDPNSYFAPSTAANRSFYSPYSLQPQFMANGGIARHFDNGGSASNGKSTLPSRPVKGRGDGRSDDIPAMLSDGEFVVSAPVVSALGRGSNDAGARKLAKMQKSVLNKNYKSGKPPKSMGIGGYVH